eukprot:2778145-Alexandrium_andersonii.AAC.1
MILRIAVGRLRRAGVGEWWSTGCGCLGAVAAGRVRVSSAGNCTGLLKAALVNDGCSGWRGGA